MVGRLAKPSFGAILKKKGSEELAASHEWLAALQVEFQVNWFGPRRGCHVSKFEGLIIRPFFWFGSTYPPSGKHWEKDTRFRWLGFPAYVKLLGGDTVASVRCEGQFMKWPLSHFGLVRFRWVFLEVFELFGFFLKWWYPKTPQHGHF